jgi:hypothetical protein
LFAIGTAKLSTDHWHRVSGASLCCKDLLLGTKDLSEQRVCSHSTWKKQTKRICLSYRTRIKKVAGIKSLDVYALALYVDEQQTKTALSKFSSQPRERIANDPTLFPELMKADWVEKSLVLVITSGLVKRRNFLEALEERLKPPLIQKRQELVLESFRNLFDTVEFKKGLQISFTFCGNKTLKTRAGGKDLGTLANPELSSTLLDIYLGSNPVSPQAKNAFANGLASMISKN